MFFLYLTRRRKRLGVKILVVPSKAAGNQMGTGWDQMGTETGVEIPVVPSKVAGNQMGIKWESNGNQMGTFEQVPSTTETST